MERYISEKFHMIPREVLMYIFFGILTVIVNTAIFFGASYFFSIIIANTIAFIIAVSFAYVTNGKYVFQNEITLSAFSKFILMRLATLIIDTGGLYFMINLGVDKLLAKVITNIIVIILNYLISKIFIFKK